jgi:hypothetical protein
VRALSPAFSREKSIAARSITSSEALTIRIEEIAFVRAQYKRKNGRLFAARSTRVAVRIAYDGTKLEL